MKKTVFLLLLPLLTACPSVGVYHIGTTYDQTRPESLCHLDVYWSVSEVSEPVQDLCRIETDYPIFPWTETVLDRAFNISVPLACGCGAQALYFTRIGKQGITAVAASYRSSRSAAGSDLDLVRQRLVCVEKGLQWQDSTCVAKAETDSLDEAMKMRSRP